MTPILLAQRLLGDRLAGGHRPGDHDGLVALDHAAGAVTGGVGVGLGVAGHVFDLAAEHAVALQRQRLHRLQQAAVAFAVDVLDGEFVALELLQPLFGIGAGLRHVETENDLAAGRVIAEILRPGSLGENMRRAERDNASTRPLEQASPVGTKNSHFISSLQRGRHAASSSGHSQ